MRYKVCYPSGMTFQTTGELSIAQLKPKLMCPMITNVNNTNQDMALDPRGVIFDEREEIVYNPRDVKNLENMDEDLRRWLEDPKNAAWPPSTLILLQRKCTN